MTLRAVLIEAMAGGPDVHPAIKELAGLYLDRALDTLETRTDEWAEAEATLQPRPTHWQRVTDEQAERLLAVLREDTHV